MVLRNLFFILLVMNVRGESASTLQKASLQNDQSQSFGVNTQVFTMFLYNGRHINVYRAPSNEHGNADSPRMWIFYYEPVVTASLGKDLNGNLSTAWIVGNDVRVNILLGSPKIEEVAREAITKKVRQDEATYAEYWDVAPRVIDSLTAYIVTESGNPIEGVHPFKMVHPNEFIIQAHFSCSTREKAEKVLRNILDGVYEVEIAFFFAGTRRESTNSVSITAAQLENVLRKTVADAGNTKALYIHRGQFSNFVSKCIRNANYMIYHRQYQQKMIEQLQSLLQQGKASSVKTNIDAEHWDQVWLPAELNPEKITREMNDIFVYNEEETKKHNFSFTFFDQRKGAPSTFENFDYQEQAQNGRQIVSLTEINYGLNRKKHLQVKWTGKKLIPMSFSVIRLSDLHDSVQVQLSKKNLEAEKARGAVVHTLKGLHGSNTEDSMAAINEFKSILGKNYVDTETCKHKSKTEIDELKKKLEDAKKLQMNSIELIQHMNTSLQANKENAKKLQMNFTELIKHMSTSLQAYKEKSKKEIDELKKSLLRCSVDPDDHVQQTNMSHQEIKPQIGKQLFQYSFASTRRASVETFGKFGQISLFCSSSGLFTIETGGRRGTRDWTVDWLDIVKGRSAGLWWWLMMPHPVDNLVVLMALMNRDNTPVIRTQYYRNNQLGFAPPYFTIECVVTVTIPHKFLSPITRTQRIQYRMALVHQDTVWSDFVTFPAQSWYNVNQLEPPTVQIQLINLKL